jgi:Protein of unknown function (DUF3106)
MKLRSVLSLIAAAALTGFALRPDIRPTADVDPQVFRANFERWQTLPEAEREALRERYSRYRELPPGDQETLQQRADTLRRVRGNLAQRQGHDPSAEELATELTRLVDIARRTLPRAPGAPELADAELLAAMEARTRRSVSAFLDKLAARGEITQQELTRLRAQPLAEQLRDALLLLKSNQIRMSGSEARLGETDELRRLPPLDVAARIERVRQQHGFLGRLGQAVPLSDDDRRTLAADDSAPDFGERLRDLKAPKVRELLASKGVPADRIDALLAGPVADLEREADTLLAAELQSR